MTKTLLNCFFEKAGDCQSCSIRVLLHWISKGSNKKRKSVIKADLGFIRMPVIY
jgi:hypothetical protein